MTNCQKTSLGWGLREGFRHPLGDRQDPTKPDKMLLSWQLALLAFDLTPSGGVARRVAAPTAG